MAQNNQIAAALSAARVELNDLHAEAVLLAGKTDDPDSPEWAKVDQGITAATAKIRRLEAMQAAGKVYMAGAAVADLQARRVVAKESALNLARERVKIARKIDNAIAALGGLLGEWDDMSAECHRHAAFLHSSDSQQSWQEAMMNAARGNSARFSSALHWSLFTAGIGRSSIYLEHPLQHRQIGAPVTMEDAATYTAEQLDAQLKRSLETLKVQ